LITIVDMSKRMLGLVLVLLFFGLFPFISQSDYYIHVMILALMWVIVGSAWNLLAGYTGQVSFGHAVFFGTGAYTAGLFVTKLGISAWWGMAFGGLAAVLVGLFIGGVCFRLRGPYFALATIAMGEIFRLVATNWKGFTEGMLGILIMQTFTSKLPYYYLVLALAVLCIYSMKKIMDSRWGYYFLAIRENQDVAESLGISSTLYKNISLAISAFFTGTAGAFYMNYMAFIDPEVVFSLYHVSIMAILVGIIGGVATLYGPAVGAFIMVGVQEIFRSSLFGLAPKWMSQLHVLVFGLLVIFVILFLGNGIVGDWKKITRAILRSSR